MTRSGAGAAGFVGLAVSFLVLSWGYAVTSPPFENPDEVAHARYVAFFADTGRLPDVHGDCVRMAYHPPLYYALVSPVAFLLGVTTESVFDGYRINRDSSRPLVVLTHGYPDESFPYVGSVRFLRIVRAIGGFLGLVCLFFTYRLAALFFDAPAVRVFATALVGMLPQFQYIAASVNHDVLAAAASAGFLYFLVRLEKDPGRSAVPAGVALGCALLAKASTLALAPLVVFGLTGVARSEDRGRLARRGAALILLPLLIAGWWYLRNGQLYGSPLPTLDLVRTTWIGAGVLRPAPPTAAEWPILAGVLFRSYVFLGGLLNVAGASWLYLLWGGLLAFGVVGSFFSWRSADGGGRLLSLAVAFVLAALVAFNLVVSSPQGRYLFIVAPALAVLSTMGLSRVFGRWLPRMAIPATIALGIAAFLQLGLDFAPVYHGFEPRRREAQWAKTARLFCGNDYTFAFVSAGGRVRALVMDGRTIGDGRYRVVATLRRDPTSAALATAEIASGDLPTERDALRFVFDPPLETEPGETIFLRLAAPEATPASKPEVFYLRQASLPPQVWATGVPVEGTTALREETVRETVVDQSR